MGSLQKVGYFGWKMVAGKLGWMDGSPDAEARVLNKVMESGQEI